MNAEGKERGRKRNWLPAKFECGEDGETPEIRKLSQNENDRQNPSKKIPPVEECGYEK